MEVSEAGNVFQLVGDGIRRLALLRLPHLQELLLHPQISFFILLLIRYQIVFEAVHLHIHHKKNLLQCR